MPPYPKTFWAAIDKGVRDIKGKLDQLNPGEKRRLLADLRERDDCPDVWKNMDSKNIPRCMHKAIARLLNPEKAKAAAARNNKRLKLSGEAKKRNDRNNAKISKALREANRQAILENQDHHEPTWPEDTLEKKATGIVEYIVKRCGPDGFVHICGGAWPGMTVNEAAEAECFGKGRNRHAVFIDGTNSRHKFVRYRDVSTHVELFTPYTGTNCENADELEKRVQTKLIDMEWPQYRRMFVHAGKGTCKGKREAKTPFPYYTCVLICEQSMEQIGIRRATKKDHAPKRKRSSSSL